MLELLKLSNLSARAAEGGAAGAWLSDWKNSPEPGTAPLHWAAWECRSPISRCWRKRQPSSGPDDSIPGHSIPRARWRSISARSDITPAAILPLKLFPWDRGRPAIQAALTFIADGCVYCLRAGGTPSVPGKSLSSYILKFAACLLLALLLAANHAAGTRHTGRQLVAVSW